MLTTLHISGYALIDSLDVEFGPGLNIITGETGAGKSILIGALKMILGGRASTDIIRTGAKKAIIEGCFTVEKNSAVQAMLTEYSNDDLNHLILRREISPGGSRAFVNDYPVPVSVLKEIASEIIDLHGQHDQQSLLRRETHLVLLDVFGRHHERVDEYVAQLESVRKLALRIDSLKERKRELAEREELRGFQLNEIDAIAPQADEEEVLNRERKVLENAEKLQDTASVAYEELYGSSESIYDRLAEVQRSLTDAARLDDKFSAFSKELASASISIDEMAKELSHYAESVASDEDRLGEVRDRLGQFELLKRKYGGTIESVLTYREEISRQVSESFSLDGELRDLSAQLASARKALSSVAMQLSAERKATAAQVESLIVAELETLGMAKSQFRVQFERELADDGLVDLPDSSGTGATGSGSRCRAFADGIDRVEFLLSTNPGEPVRSLRRVASGGEVSRIMLALKQILAQREGLPILVFDEIDVGISGAIAQRAGERMSALAARHQLLTITHLPQIAACADLHFVVEKRDSGDRTRTGIRRLTPEEQAVHVAALISGSEVTPAGLESARELLKAHTN